MIQKKNKEFNNKCAALKNRIQILKKEEENYRNQLKFIKKREEQDRLIQNDKIKIKIELEKMKLENNKELMKKKERVQRYKARAKNRMEEKKNENISKKKRKYQSALNDKYLMKCIIEEINTQQHNKNNYRHAKIKQELNEFETNRMKRNIMKENKEQYEYENNLKVLKKIEQKMVTACNELENMEKKALENLNKTKDYNMKYIENSSDSKSKYYFSHKIFVPLKHMNRSMDIEYYDDKKFNNSLLSPSIHSKQNDTKDKINNISFTQSSSMSNFRTKKIKQNDLYRKRNNDSLYEKKGFNRSFMSTNSQRNKRIKKIDINSNNKDIKEKDKIKNKEKEEKNINKKNNKEKSSNSNYISAKKIKVKKIKK